MKAQKIVALTTPICEGYEYIWYNEKLRIIHSIKDNMFQMQSIVKACNSKKQVRHWFENKSTKEFLKKADGRILPPEKTYENRPNLPSGLQGYYVHRLLVNHIAMWASPDYAWDIMTLLDSYFEQQRKVLQEKIDQLQKQNKKLQEHVDQLQSKTDDIEEERDDLQVQLEELQVDFDELQIEANDLREQRERFAIETDCLQADIDRLQTKKDELQKQVHELHPRAVPKGKEKYYFYLIWKEELNENRTKLHLVRRQKRSYNSLPSEARNPSACLFYIEDLPIAMTPNDDIKQLAEENFGSQVTVRGCSIEIENNLLDDFKELVTRYFNEYQE